VGSAPGLLREGAAPSDRRRADAEDESRHGDEGSAGCGSQSVVGSAAPRWCAGLGEEGEGGGGTSVASSAAVLSPLRWLAGREDFRRRRTTDLILPIRKQ
jgi:hypothetical protein